MIPLSKAIPEAKKIIELLSPHCQRIQVAGSIRRKKASVKDIEIVLIPKMTTPSRRSSAWCSAIIQVGQLRKGAKQRGGLNVAKYLQFTTPNQMTVDIFIAAPENWGMTLFIRTGSSEYVHRAFTAFNKKGWKSIEGVHTDKDGKQIQFKEESEIFDFFNMGFINPENRI